MTSLLTLSDVMATGHHAAVVVKVSPGQTAAVVGTAWSGCARAGPRLYRGAAFANAVEEDEAKALYEQFAVPAPGAPLFQAATANLNPSTEVKVDTENPERGPLLLISGETDDTVPWAIVHASFEKQKRNPGVVHLRAESRRRPRGARGSSASPIDTQARRRYRRPHHHGRTARADRRATDQPRRHHRRSRVSRVRVSRGRGAPIKEVAARLRPWTWVAAGRQPPG
jgi:hypothetical protein